MCLRYPLQTSACVLAALLIPFAFGQGLADQTATTDDDIVRLSPFEVSSVAPARYQSAEAAAGGRISTSIMDSPTTVTVLTRDFLNDVSGTRVLDAAKYVAGVGEARIPGASDRVTIRGFESDGRRVDGFSQGDRANYDDAGVERVEVVKGPDAVLHPSGPPGGTINLVTKKPQWTYGGSIKIQVGEYDTNRAEVDVTGPINEHFAYRMVASLQSNEGYIDTYERDSFLFTPSLAWRISPQANLTLRYEYYDFYASSLVATATDPSVGTKDPFKVLQGVPFNFNPTLGRRSEFRHTTSNTGTLLFTSTITDRLSVRLAGRVSEAISSSSNLRLRMSPVTPPPTSSWTNINPLTGEWVADMLFDPDPPYAPIPAPAMSPIIGLTGTQQETMVRHRDLQNDWSYIVDADAAKSTTLIGFAYGYQSNPADQYRRTGPSIDITTQTRPSGPVVIGPLNAMNVRQETRYQVYLTQQLELFNKRLILSGGVSHLTFNGYTGNKLSAAVLPPAPNPKVAGQMFPGSGSEWTKNYGVVVKPMEGISLYYGHTENAVPVGDFEQVALGNAPTFSAGEQDEFGIKGSFLGGRIIASIAYYEITQGGYGVFNPGNFATPQPPILLPSIYVSRQAEGWEFQVTGSVTPSLSVIASYTDTTNRDPNGNMLAGAAENLATAYVRYAFLNGAAKGLSFAIGANYSSERAIENVTGYTPASTDTALIPIRSSGFLPSQTLVDATISYARGAWSYSLTAANALDKKYYAAADSRYLINVGTPRNLYGSVTWKF